MYVLLYDTSRKGIALSQFLHSAFSSYIVPSESRRKIIMEVPVRRPDCIRIFQNLQVPVPRYVFAKHNLVTSTFKCIKEANVRNMRTKNTAQNLTQLEGEGIKIIEQTFIVRIKPKITNKGLPQPKTTFKRVTAKYQCPIPSKGRVAKNHGRKLFNTTCSILGIVEFNCHDSCRRVL